VAGRDSNTARKGRSLGPASRQLNWAATLAAKGPGALQPQHLHFRRQPQGRKTLHLVLLDQSASMLRRQKLAWAKGCLLALSALFYRRRDAMAVLGFAGEQAQWLQKPGKAGLFNEHWIAPLRGGGATPIQSAIDAVQDAVRRAPAGTRAAVWLLTDGRFDPLPPSSKSTATSSILKTVPWPWAAATAWPRCGAAPACLPRSGAHRPRAKRRRPPAVVCNGNWRDPSSHIRADGHGAAGGGIGTARIVGARS